MLTLSQDWTVRDGQLVETAWGDGREVSARSRATCLLAETMIRDGVPPDTPVRLVRFDPYLFPAPHNISGIGLALVARVDFFAVSCPAMRDEIRRALGLAGQSH